MPNATPAPPPGQPGPVTAREIADLLAMLDQPATRTDPAARLVYLDRKAGLLARIAADTGTADARTAAGSARALADELRSQIEAAS